MEILLDTNFLIYIAKYKLIDSLYDMHPEKLIVPVQVFNELGEIARRGNGKDSWAAKISILVVEKWKNEKKLFVVNSTYKYTDKALLEISKAKRQKGAKIFVATLDNMLIKKLKKAKIGIMKIRQKKYLIIE